MPYVRKSILTEARSTFPALFYYAPLPETPSMTRLIFPTTVKAKQALEELNLAVAEVKKGKALRSVVKEFKNKNPRSSLSRGMLQRALHKPAPTIQKSNGNYYLRWIDSKTHGVFTPKEESALVKRIEDRLEKVAFLQHQDVQALAMEQKKDILRNSGANNNNRKILRKTDFKYQWFHSFIKRHSKELSRLKSRPVEHQRVLAFNGDHVGNFFAQVRLIYKTYKISEAWQVLNLDETGFTPGRDLKGTTPQKCITKAGNRAVWPQVSFKYTNRISLLFAIGADGQEYSPAVVFKGVREPTLSDHVSSEKVSRLMPTGWVCYWRRDVASFDQRIFRDWVDKFIVQVRIGKPSSAWLILFYDACRAHLTSGAISKMRDEKIAVCALPAHTSDNLQPLDVSVFGPFSNFVNSRIMQLALEDRIMNSRPSKMSGREVWDSICEGHDRSFTSKNIQSGFRRTGLWPLSLRAVIPNGVRRSITDGSLVSLKAVERKIDERALYFKRFGLPEPVIRSGFVDTTHGIELTRPEVLEMLRVLEMDRKEIALDKERNQDIRRTQELAQAEQRRQFAEKVQMSKAIDRHRRHGMEIKLPRCFKERRLAAKELMLKRRFERLTQGAASQ